MKILLVLRLRGQPTSSDNSTTSIIRETLPTVPIEASQSKMSHILDTMNRNSHPEIVVTDTDISIHDTLNNDNSVGTNGNDCDERLQGNNSDSLTEISDHNGLVPREENIAECDFSITDISTELPADNLYLKTTNDLIVDPINLNICGLNPDTSSTMTECPVIKVTSTQNLDEHFTRDFATSFTKKYSNNLDEDLTENLTENLTEDLTENLTVNLTENLTEQESRSTEQLDEEIFALRLSTDLVII